LPQIRDTGYKKNKKRKFKCRDNFKKRDKKLLNFNPFSIEKNDVLAVLRISGICGKPGSAD
jgi:hypothetical protein